MVISYFQKFEIGFQKKIQFTPPMEFLKEKLVCYSTYMLT
jgi:hypothetical protein